MGRQKEYTMTFKCKLCKFFLELSGTKENIVSSCDILVKNHKEYSPDCKADKYDNFLVERVDDESQYSIEARRILKDSYERTEKILSKYTSDLLEIIGNDEAKRIFEERLIDHIKYKDRLLRLKFHDECGIILAGIQGTGKTYMVATIINKTILCNSSCSEKFDVLVMRASDFVQGNVGATSKMISSLLDLIRSSNKESDKETILIIDEIDSLLPKRKTDRISSKEKMSAILDEFGGIHDDHSILVIGMTNLPDDIDNHALVTGRFGSPILINIPTKEEKFQMFLNFSKGYVDESGKFNEKQIKYEKEVDSCFIDKVLSKFSGRDVKNFVKDLHKINMKKYENGEHNSDVIITQEDVIELYERSKYSMVTGNNLDMLDNLSKYYDRYGIDVTGSSNSGNKEKAFNIFKELFLDISNESIGHYEFTKDVYDSYCRWRGTGYVEMSKIIFNRMMKSDNKIKMGNPKDVRDGKQHDAYFNVRLRTSDEVKKLCEIKNLNGELFN